MDDAIRERKPTDPPPVPAEAIDAAYEAMKQSGALQRAEADRALAMQIDRQGQYSNTGLWA